MSNYLRKMSNNKKPSVIAEATRSAQASQKTAYICFLLFTDSTTFLVEKDQHRSLPAFASSNISTRIRAITARHSLFRLSHTRIVIGFSYESLSPKGTIWVFHVPRKYQSRLGSAFSPVVQHLRLKELVTSNPDHLPFWFKPVSIFGLLPLTTFISSSLSLTILLDSSSVPS